MTDKFTARSRGFGFVEMAHDQEAQDAIARFHGYEFLGRALTVNVAKPREERDGVRRSGFAGDRRSGFSGERKSGGHGERGWSRTGGGRDRRW